MLMRTFLFLFFATVTTAVSRAETRVPQTPVLSNEGVVSKARKSHPKAFRLGMFSPQKKYQDYDKLAVIAICLDGVAVVATLFTYLVWGGVAAGFALAFSSIFVLAGGVLAVISLVRAALRGWRRGTFWAVLALGLPLLFLLLTVLTG